MSAASPASPARFETLRFEPTFEAWRAAARRALGAGLRPETVGWEATGEGGQLALGLPGLGPPSKAAASSSASADARVPKTYLRLARRACHHSDPARWSLLYRVLWRVTHGEPHLLEVSVDPDVARLSSLAREVRRDAHKMKAFVRFRRVTERPESGAAAEPVERYVAWHRPDHPIVRLVAPFFAQRFNDQRWAILTPWGSAFWDLEELTFGPPAPRSAAPTGDELETLWRTYYRNIFNPARLKVRAMVAELPKRHWATLPEAVEIPGLIRDAADRTRGMVEVERLPAAERFFPPEPTLASLGEAVQRCRACDLCGPATQAVWGEGPADARLVLVGEQPGDLEDRTGRPFVGPAGEILDECLEAAGLDRSRLYLTNTVKHFKFRLAEEAPAAGLGAWSQDGPERGKRRLHQSPNRTEVSSCLPWVERELALIRPRGVVCLGATAARALIGGHVRVSRDRGRPHETRHAPWAIPTFHPSAILRIPDADSRRRARASLIADLRQAGDRIAAAAGRAAP